MHKSICKSIALSAALSLSSVLFSSPVLSQDTNTCNDDGSDSIWCKTVYFGVQFHPNYNTEIENEFDGLGKQSLFGQFTFDAVRNYEDSKDDFGFDDVFDQDKNEHPDHFGFSISFYKSGAVSEGSNTPEKFDQIAETMTFETYLVQNRWGSRALETNEGSDYGFRYALGTRTREGSLKGEDTLTTYGMVGFNYAYYENLTTSTKNTLPIGEFFAGFAYFEDWPVSSSNLRYIFRGVYNIANQYYLGILINGGGGQDDLSVFFGIRRSTDDLLSFIGLNKG